MSPHVYVSSDLLPGESLADYRRRVRPVQPSLWRRLWARLKG